MRRLAIAVLLACSCAADHTNPPSGSGGPGMGGRRQENPDGSTTDGNGDLLVLGTLCPISNVKRPRDCGGSTGPAGVPIRAGAVQTTSDASGNFSLSVLPGPTTFVVADGSTELRTTAVPVVVPETGIANLRLATVSEFTWADVLASTGAFEPDGSASIALYISANGLPLANASVVAPAGTATIPFYDTDGQQTWEAGTQTGGDGVVLLFGVPSAAGTVGITITELTTGTQSVVNGVPVVPDALTIIGATVELP